MTIRNLFRLVYGLFLLFVLAIGIVTVLMVQNQRKLEHSQRVRFDSYLLAEELRQSSDDLTRFVRTYVVTGNPKYEKYYRDVLAIRKGEKERPENYQRIYWDIVSATGRPPRPNGEAVSLTSLMKELGFTDEEFAKLEEAQNNSDELVKTEEIAMHAMKGLYDDGTGNYTKRGKPNQAMAIRILHDAKYHEQKAKIMKPIDDFFEMLDNRTASTMRKYERRSDIYLALNLAMLIVLLSLTVVSSVIIGLRITSPVALIQEQTRLITEDVDRYTDIIKEISQGHLDAKFTMKIEPLKIKATDEVGQLVKMQNHMIERLREASVIIARITSDISESSKKINSANDVLEQKNRDLNASNKRLQELESLRDSLTHMIIHDMRTPLTSIYGYMMSIKMYEDECLTRQGKEFLSSAMESTQNLIDIVSSLLDISKMESGEMMLDIERVDLANIAEQVLSEMEPLREDRQLMLAKPDEPIVVGADAQLIRRVFQNLIDNAVKFTPSNGEVRIGIQRKENEIRVTIKDNGPGIPKHFQEKVFEKFGQVDTPVHQRKYSTGLGLTFCKLAVEAHGGRIGVNSELGKGSTFWFTLPAES